MTIWRHILKLQAKAEREKDTCPIWNISLPGLGSVRRDQNIAVFPGRSCPIAQAKEKLKMPSLDLTISHSKHLLSLRSTDRVVLSQVQLPVSKKGKGKK